MPAKPHLNLVFIGHVDHGKSTTVGRILYDTGNIDPHELENLKKLVEQLIVAINKMDASKPPYAEARFNELKTELTGLLRGVGYKVDKVPFIPISSYKGENIVKASTKMAWYKGSSLVEALNQLTVPPKPTNLPLRLPVQDVYSITGAGTVPVGRVETGLLKVGMKIHFIPADKVGEVKSIEMHHEQIQQAEPGDNVGFNVRGVDKKDLRRGDVAGPTDSPPTVAKSFTAQIIVLNHPSVITAGYTPGFHAHTAQVAGTFEEIIAVLDPKTGAPKAEKPDFLKTGDAARVKIRPTKPLVIEAFKAFPQMGRFAVRDMGQTVAAGQVIDVEKR